MDFPTAEPGAGDFSFGDEAQYIFTDTELDSILNAVEDRVRGGGGGATEQVFLDFLGGDDNQQPLPLQFQPRSLETHEPSNSLSAAAAAQDAVASVPLGGALGGVPLPGAAPSTSTAPPQLPSLPSSAITMPALTSSTLTPGALLSGAVSSPQGTPVPQHTLAAPGLPGVPPPPGIPTAPTLPMGFPQLMVQVLPAQAALAAHLQQQQQQSIAAALAPQLAAAVHAHAAPMAPLAAPPAQVPARVASPTYRHTGRAQAAEAAAGSRAPVSHSTVEKQRRDRINSLIDELRDLVPPTQQQQQQQQQIGVVTIGVSDNPEASSRRPKHVVLADTINLLKALRQRVSFAAVTAELQQLPAGGSGGGGGGGGGGALPLPLPVPGMYGAVAGAGMVPGMPGSGVQPVKQEPQGSSSQDDDDMGHPGGPGVTVKKGPDCFYVQVTCPDRKGLLSDITDTLRNLSLEVRTAAVTTNGGSVRDVFEVVPPDGAAALAPEAVQSMVQGALSQRVAEGQQEVTAGKRPRA